MEGLDGRTQYLCHAGTGAPEYSGLQSWVPKEQVAEVVAEPVLDLCIFPEPRGRGAGKVLPYPYKASHQTEVPSQSG